MIPLAKTSTSAKSKYLVRIEISSFNITLSCFVTLRSWSHCFDACTDADLGFPDQTEDKILAQMGKYTEEAQTPEERDQFVAGLKQVISDLRRTGVKDFDLVAQELAAYRRRFQEERDSSSRPLPS